MRTRKTPHTHAQTHKERERCRERERDQQGLCLDACDRIEECLQEREREREREGEGPTRFVCWTRATELKIVGERERERA